MKTVHTRTKDFLQSNIPIEDVRDLLEGAPSDARLQITVYDDAVGTTLTVLWETEPTRHPGD